MKYKFLSLLFSGKAWNKVLSIFTDDEASLEVAEKGLADADAANQKLKQENEAHTQKIGELTKSVSDLTGQVKTLEAEKQTLTSDKEKLTADKAELQKKLDAKPAGHATTATSEADPEEGKEKSTKYHTKVDDEVEKYMSNKPKK